MISGPVRILLFSGAGRAGGAFLLPFIPGPVIDLVLLIVGLHGVLGAVTILPAARVFAS